MESRAIKDSAITASSSYDQYTAPENARLRMKISERRDSAGWSPITNADTQWLQVDFPTVMNITRIATQGGRYYDYTYSSYFNGWVKRYTLAYKLDGQRNFHDYQNSKVNTWPFPRNW